MVRRALPHPHHVLGDMAAILILTLTSPIRAVLFCGTKCVCRSLSFRDMCHPTVSIRLDVCCPRTPLRKPD